MTQAIVSLHQGKTPLCFPVDHQTTLDLKHSIYVATCIPIEDQVLRTLDGHYLSDQTPLDRSHDIYLTLSGKLVGGKGGFGSMLRAQGGRMNAQKTTNFEACRDLQGRRIRTVNEAKKLQEELDAIPKQEEAKRERLKRKIEEALKEREPRKYLFDDNQFLEDREDVVEHVKSAVGSAMKKQKTTHSSSSSSSSSTSLFDDDVSEEEEEEEEEEDKEDEEEEEEEEEEDKEDKPKEDKPKEKGKAKA